MKKITVIGGGTGTFTVLSGLKKFPHLSLTAIVTSFDSGGSSGRLRDEFGYLPVGDFRQALVALGKSEGENSLLRRLFNYRFKHGGPGLTGHNMGNLILTALTDILGSETEAINQVGSIFEINGRVFPVTLSQKISLWAQYMNGKIVHGESAIDEPKLGHDQTAAIARIWLEPQPKINPKAKSAIGQSDLLVFGPGDFFTSVLPNTLIKGFKLAIKKTHAKTVFVMNLINKIGQTFNMTASDYLEKFEEYVGKLPEFVIINSSPLPGQLLKKYAAEGSLPIINNLKSTSQLKIIRADLLAQKSVKSIKGDTLKRSLIRHDPEKLSKIIASLVI